MKGNGERSLKSLNMKWLVLLAVADVLVVLFFVAPEFVKGASLAEIATGRVIFTTVAPVVVLLIVNVLPHSVKSSLVYWKPIGALPGAEAFSKFGPADPRIDMAALEKNVGTLPTAPTEQNSKWYKLYKQVSHEIEVVEAHKLFLMYRDMAVLSLALLVIMPMALFVAGASFFAPWVAVGLFVVQYLMTAFSARWSGVRLVCNVLAVHSASKIKVPRASSTTPTPT